MMDIAFSPISEAYYKCANKCDTFYKPWDLKYWHGGETDEETLPGFYCYDCLKKHGAFGAPHETMGNTITLERFYRDYWVTMPHSQAICPDLRFSEHRLLMAIQALCSRNRSRSIVLDLKELAKDSGLATEGSVSRAVAFLEKSGYVAKRPVRAILSNGMVQMVKGVVLLKGYQSDWGDDPEGAYEGVS